MRLRACACAVSVWRARVRGALNFFFFSKRIYRVELSPAEFDKFPARRLGVLKGGGTLGRCLEYVLGLC